MLLSWLYALEGEDDDDEWKNIIKPFSFSRFRNNQTEGLFSFFFLIKYSRLCHRVILFFQFNWPFVIDCGNIHIQMNRRKKRQIFYLSVFVSHARICTHRQRKNCSMRWYVASHTNEISIWDDGQTESKSSKVNWLLDKSKSITKQSIPTVLFYIHHSSRMSMFVCYDRIRHIFLSNYVHHRDYLKESRIFNCVNRWFCLLETSNQA